jgi:outer membrane receptor protein involved in Fe transport
METQARFALTSVAGAIAAALYPSLQAVAQDDADRGAVLEEIIVTATKREMSVQDIPATIQAITEESLKSMGAKSMEDYARFIPSVNVVNLTNGSSTVIFRGAINSASFIAQSTSSVYLDEMSVTNTGSQPEIRMVDIERVEALSGPQGTLYGSDAQAGTMRIVTNKPVMNEFEVKFDAELRSGSDSEESYRGSLTVNIPLVEDRLALRLVGFSDRDGGFIDNVFGHTPDTLALRNYISYPAEWGSLDNADAVEKDWNDSEVYGGRAALRWEMNDNWAVTLSTAHQVTDSGASNDYDPFVGDLQTIRFHDEYRYDEFNIHSLVLEADLGFAQLVSATGYYDRDIRQLWDTTVYGHYWTAQYCQDSLYTTVYDPLRPNYYAPDYFANPATGYVIWWPVYCQGQTAESDFFAPDRKSVV